MTTDFSAAIERIVQRVQPEDFQGVFLLTHSDADGADQQLLLAEHLATRNHHVIDFAQTPAATWDEWLAEYTTEDDDWDVVHLVNVGQALVQGVVSDAPITWLADWQANPAALNGLGRVVLLWADAYASELLRNEAPAWYAALAAHETLSADEQSLTARAMELWHGLANNAGDTLAERYIALGKVLAQLHLAPEAMQQFDKVIDAENPITENPIIVADAYFQAGALHGNLGEVEDAWACLLQTVEILSGADTTQKDIAAAMARTHTGIAQLFANAENVSKALQHHRLAIPFFETAEDALGIGYAYKAIATYELHKGNQQEAIRCYGIAAQQFSEARPSEAADCHFKKGFVYKWQDAHEAALAAFQDALPLAIASGETLLIDGIKDSIEEMQETLKKASAAPAQKKGFWAKLLG